MTDTKTCVTCKQPLPLTEEHFGRSKNWVTGWNSSCKPCAQAKRRAYKKRREEGMTDDEWRAQHKATLKAKKKYREENKEKLRDKKVAYKRKAAIPQNLKELDHLLNLQRFKEYAQAREEARRNRQPVPKTDRNWYTEEHELMKLEAYKGRSYLENRIAELQAFIESCSEEEIEAALELSREREANQYTRDPIVDPAIKRWFKRFIRQWNKREREMTDEQTEARKEAQWQAIWADFELLKAEGKEEDFILAIAEQERENYLADIDGRTPDVIVEPDVQWGGLARHLDEMARSKDE